MKNYYEKQIDYLFDMAYIEQCLVCSSCKKEGKKHEFDAEDAIYSFYNDGWRVIGHRVYCPECVKSRKQSTVRKEHGSDI